MIACAVSTLALFFALWSPLSEYVILILFSLYHIQKRPFFDSHFNFLSIYFHSIHICYSNQTNKQSINYPSNKQIINHSIPQSLPPLQPAEWCPPSGCGVRHCCAPRRPRPLHEAVPLHAGEGEEGIELCLMMIRDGEREENGR